MNGAGWVWTCWPPLKEVVARPPVNDPGEQTLFRLPWPAALPLWLLFERQLLSDMELIVSL